jgi:hypothetical protein
MTQLFNQINSLGQIAERRTKVYVILVHLKTALQKKKTEADGGAAHSNENVRDGLGDEWSESAQHFIHAKRLSRV